MANPLTKEQEFYEQIKKEKITVHPVIWDTMYHYLGDYISVINSIATYYIEKNESISLDDAQKILEYTAKIGAAVDKVLYPQKIQNEGQYWDKVKAAHITLHPIIREFFMHYIGNDTHVINLCVSFYLDPIDRQPIPVKDAERILRHTISMREFLDRLQEATKVEKKAKVLVVDDEAGICSYMQKFLSLKGFEVFTAVNSDEALAIYEKEKPGICILDVLLDYSKLDGIKILEEIKKQNPETKCVMVARLDDEQEDSRKLQDQGADTVFQKPVELHILLKYLNDLSAKIKQG